MTWYDDDPLPPAREPLTASEILTRPVEDGPFPVGRGEYHRDRRRDSSSTLEAYRRDPLRYRAEYVLGTWTRPDSDEFRFGRAVHCALLEPDHFESDYAVVPKFDRRTKAGREAFEEARAEARGREILSADEWQEIVQIRAAVAANPTASRLLSSLGVCEYAVQWNDPDGLPMKAMYDRLVLLPDDLAGELQADYAILDAKTTTRTDLKAWAWSARDYGYHRQAAVYLRGADAALGLLPTLWSDRPTAWRRHESGCGWRPQVCFLHLVLFRGEFPQARVARMDRAVLLWADGQIGHTIRHLADSKQFDHWPAPRGVEEVTFPLA